MGNKAIFIGDDIGANQWQSKQFLLHDKIGTFHLIN